MPAIGVNRRIDVPLIGDLRAIVPQLVEALGATPRAASPELDEWVKKDEARIAELAESAPAGRTPIHTARFHSNWELSTSRAIHVMEQLVASGVDPQRVSVQGFADTRARARRAAEPGAEDPSEDARAADRRVVLRVVEIFERTE